MTRVLLLLACVVCALSATEAAQRGGKSSKPNKASVGRSGPREGKVSPLPKTIEDILKDPISPYVDKKDREAAAEFRRRFAEYRAGSGSSGPAGRETTREELLQEGRELYGAGNLRQAALAFELELSRVTAEARLDAKQEALNQVIDILSESPIWGPRLRTRSVTAEELNSFIDRFGYRERVQQMEEGIIRSQSEEPRKWLRRTKAREASTAMGPGVIVIERLVGEGPLPEVPPPPDIAFSVRQLMDRRGTNRRPGENVFHVSNRDGSLDFEIGVVTRGELLSKLTLLGGKTPNGFVGTVVLSQEASRAGVDVERAFQKGFVVHDPGLPEAVVGMAALRKPPSLASGARTVAVLLPRDGVQQKAMGLDFWGEQGRAHVWKYVTEWAITTRFGSLITWRSNGFRPTALIRKIWNQQTDREVLLKSLVESKEVLILFAHGNRNSLALPDGSKLTVEEVRKMKLTQKPVVLLLSCEGAKPEASEATQSFSEALKEAGAAAVYGAEQKLDVRTALSIAERFAERRATAKSTLEIIRRIDEEQRRIGETRMRLKVMRGCVSTGTTTGTIRSEAAACWSPAA